jgi:hypothetical protein
MRTDRRTERTYEANSCFHNLWERVFECPTFLCTEKKTRSSPNYSSTVVSLLL